MINLIKNIQSTNWQTMRFKPPPANSPEIGWRVEFRPMEIQLTDSENAAFVIFIVLITRLILSFNLDLLIPLSMVEENMRRAKRRDAARDSRFWFRKDITLPQCVVNHFTTTKLKKSACENEKSVCHWLSKKLSPCYNKNKRSSCSSSSTTTTTTTTPASYLYSSCAQLSIDEIINGTNEDVKNINSNKDEDQQIENKNSFPGLIPLLNFYLDSMEIDAETRCTLSNYLTMISQRARGEVPTPARLIRDYITNHSDYQNDSLVNDSICYDLLCRLSELQMDKLSLPELLESIQRMKTKKNIDKQ